MLLVNKPKRVSFSQYNKLQTQLSDSAMFLYMTYNQTGLEGITDEAVAKVINWPKNKVEKNRVLLEARGLIKISIIEGKHPRTLVEISEV